MTTLTVRPSMNNPFWQRRDVLFVMRFLWVVLTIITIILMAVALPRAFQGALATYEDPLNWRGVAALQMGISAHALAWYYFSVDVIMMLLAGGVAMLLFWRGHRDGALILISLTLLTGPVTLSDAYSSMLVFEPQLAPALRIFGFIVSVLGFIMFLYSPDGKPVPRWAGWMMIPWILYNIVRFFVFTTASTPNEPPIYLIFYGFGLWAQVYRYRHGTPEMRQQFKWMLFGLAIAMIGLLTNVVFVFVHEDMNQFIAELITPTLMRLSFAIVNICIVIAILRYKLWDIDFVISRSLIYGLLTLLLGGVFVAGYLGVHSLMGGMFGQSATLVSAALPGVAVAVLFDPTRSRVRQFVDARFYGIHVNYREAPRADDTRPLPQAFDGARTSFGSYSSMALIGSGGMGEVYRAQHPTLNRTVAIKILPGYLLDNVQMRRRFLREAQTIAKMKQENIVAVHDFGEQDGTPYMVMEYIEGLDLSAALKQRGPIPLAEAAQLLSEIAAALDYIHENNVIHRDVKPSNVMIQPITSVNGRMHRAVLMDFGIAKVFTGTQFTAAGLVGTLDYIAPEQIQGSETVTAQADIYSLGVMAYQMLTGKLPFQHANPGALVMAHLVQPPPDPRDLVPDLPEETAAALMQAMSKKPEARFKTAGDFVRALC
jgi:tRNA A-37 threonylcarbamoyl transferase component Bud32